MNKIEEKKLFKIAKLAKEKGFKTKTVTIGFTNNYLLGGKNVMITEMCIYLWMCELQKWLREVHNIHITVTSISQESWQYHIQKPKDKLGDNYNEDYENYEEALEDGLYQALLLI